MGFLSTHALGQEPGDADAEGPTDEASAGDASPDEAKPDEAKPDEAKPSEGQAATVEAKAELPAPVEPAPEGAAKADKPKLGDTKLSGYFRGGFGASNQKGRMTCFALANPAGLVAKYRLGNECEVWAESEFKTVIYADDDGAVASVHFMPTVYIPTTYIGYSPTGVTSSPSEYTTSTGATVSFPNLYVDIEGIPWLFGGKAWVGTRYYKRESIYINDFFYWNPSGVGGGIEDVNIGKDVRVSYAAFAVDGEPVSAGAGTPPLPMQADLGIRNDLQVRGLRPYPSGEFQVGFQYIADYSNHKDANGDSVTHSGWGVTLQHVQQLLGGENKLAFQYGKGGGTGFGTLSRFYYPDFSLYFAPSEYRIRVVDVLTVQPIEWFGAQLGLVYQHDDLGNAGQKTDWYTGGTRLSFAFNKYAKVLAEVGYDRVKKSNGSEPQWLGKGTIAPAIAAGKGMFARPELRVFYTWATWNETARTATVDSGRLYTTTNLLSGVTYGLQAEAWW